MLPLLMFILNKYYTITITERSEARKLWVNYCVLIIKYLKVIKFLMVNQVI